MKVPYAWLDLVHDRGRTAIAALGVAFAVLLILMQLGFYGAVGRTAVIIQEKMDFDVLLCSRHYRFMTSPGVLPAARLGQARAVTGVQDVIPLDLSFTTWRIDGPGSRPTRAILLLGVDPDHPALDFQKIGADPVALREPDAVLIDRMSRPEFGPQVAGSRGEAGARTVTIVGTFLMGSGFGADGAILASRRTFRRLLPLLPDDTTAFGLVRVTPGRDPAAVARDLRERLPGDVRVYARDELIAHEREHWIVKTSVGVIFGTGVVTSLVVGIAIVSQVLANKIAHHFREFATMKALGYPHRFIVAGVLFQASAIALIGYLPGLLVAALGYAATSRLAHIPMQLGAGEAIAVLGLAVAMCVSAAVVTLRKVALAAPADLF